jgi:hypothetical protein
VTKVGLDGPQYTGDLLPQLARLSHLQELSLLDTSISDTDLELWKKEHPRVAVSSARRVATR